MLKITSRRRYRQLKRRVATLESQVQDLEFLKSLPKDKWITDFSRVIELLDSSTSQLRQDLVVLSLLKFKRDGYFVEFGATDGHDLSNTHLLEKQFGWNGILAEPARVYHSALRKNRNCHIDFRCVSGGGSESWVEFVESRVPALSTMKCYVDSDFHKEIRIEKARCTYNVETVSLSELLNHWQAPASIDYLSIDTEGSELEILQEFDFDMYDISVITCEHNYSGSRGRLYDLLTDNGYTRILDNVSMFDDWYVRIR